MKLHKCFFCNKIKYTPFHISEINNEGVFENFDTCEVCADTYIATLEKPKEKPKLLDLTTIETTDQLLEFIFVNAPTPIPEKTNQRTCSCGLTESEFDKIGRFGCENCYEYFKHEMESLVYPYHNAKQHVGKNPKRQTQEDWTKNAVEKEKVLKLKLAKAIELEDYEKASIINKELTSLQNQPHQETSLDQ